MPFAELSTGIEVFYRVEGSGEPLLLIMGTAADHSVWASQVEAYRGDYTVITYDARGTGRSTCPPDPSTYSMRVLGDDAAALLDHLGVERAHVSGLSLGSAAAQELARRGHAVNVWSVTSYTELARQGAAAERAALLAVGGAEERPYVETLLAGETGVFVATSDYMKALPESIARWFPGPYAVLGTDGYGLSESREALRGHFEVSKDWIAFAALATLAQANRGAAAAALDYAAEAGLDLTKAAPA